MPTEWEDQHYFERQLKLGPNATRKLLNRLVRDGLIPVIRPNRRVKRFPVQETMAALVQSSAGIAAMIGGN